jgi:HD superfamily phosphodiesterase
MQAASRTALSEPPLEMPAASTRRRRFPLHIPIALLFILLILLAGTIISVNNYIETRRLISSATAVLFESIRRETVARFESIYRPAEMLTDLLAQQRLGRATTLSERMEAVPYLAEALRHAPSVSALYVGYANGDFFLLRPLRDDPAAREPFAAPPATRFVVQSIEHDAAGGLRGSLIFLDADRAEIDRRAAAKYAFDPRTRGWYGDATKTDAQVKTLPYIFYTTREVGITFARRFDTGSAVAGRRSDPARSFRRVASARDHSVLRTGAVQRRGRSARLRQARKAGVDGGGRRRAAPRHSERAWLRALSALFDRFRATPDASKIAVSVGGRDWTGAIAHLPLAGLHGGAYLAVLSPDDEFLGAARRISRHALLITLLTMLASIPVAWLLSRLVANPLRVLAASAQSVREFDFASPRAPPSIVTEIDDLSQSMDAMKSTIRKFLDIAAALSAERNFARLLDRVLAETIGASGAGAGMVYLISDDGHTLDAAAAHATSGAGKALPLPLSDATFSQHPARLAWAERRTVVTRLEAARESLRAQFGTIVDGLERGAQTVIAVPLYSADASVIGALCVFANLRRREPLRALVSFIEALSGTAAIAIENQALLKAQRALLESFIELVAGAIDAKSPYTGGHCQRVPELTLMLARAACSAQDGPFREFALNEEEWEALRIAAWLHDCGKVTTPEYVVDKATKLETLYDRLHEVRMRFEVLKRDAEIDCWRRVADGADAIAERARLETRWHEIDADFAFVAACNEGGEAIGTRAHRAPAGRSPQERGCAPSTIASVCRATNASAKGALRCCPCQFVSLCSPISRSI